MGGDTVFQSLGSHAVWISATWKLADFVSWDRIGYDNSLVANNFN